MTFAVTVTVKTKFRRFGIYDEGAADQCEDTAGHAILDCEGDNETKFVFSAKEDKDETPPGLITVSGSLEEVDAGGNKVWNDYSREYPLNSGKPLDFEFPKAPSLSTSDVIAENADFGDFVVAIEHGLRSLKPARRKA